MSDYKINIDRPEVTSDEIKQRMDFDGLMNSYAATKPFYKTGWFAGGAATLVAAAIVGAVVLWSPESPEEAKQSNAPVASEQSQPNEAGMTADLPEKEPVVQPPLDGVDVPFEHYAVDANNGGSFEHPTGSTITVPEHAFVDEEGHPVKGEVEIEYREFHDLVEIFCSGIPMTYDSAGTQYHFETAGMCDIRGYQNGKPVYVAQGKAIDIEMRSYTENGEYNLYYLDEDKGGWGYIGQEEVRKREAEPMIGEENRHPVEDVVAADNQAAEEAIDVAVTEADGPYMRGQTTWEYKNPDSEWASPEDERNYWEVRDDTLRDIGHDCREIQSTITKLEHTEKPVEPKKADPTKPYFDIDVDPDEFPDVAEYKGIKFEVDEENSTYDGEATKEVWENVTIERREGSNYYMVFTRSDKTMELLTRPVFDGADYDAAKAQFDKKFEAYAEKRNQRLQEEAEKEAQYQARLEELRKRAEEVERANRMRYQRQLEAATTANTVYRAFQAESFGIYNCDTPRKLPNGGNIIAAFVTSEGNPVVCGSVYLADLNRKAMFTYYTLNTGTASEFKFDPRKRNIAWGVTMDGELAVCQPEGFANLPRRGKGNVPMKLSIVDFKSVDDVKEFLNI